MVLYVELKPLTESTARAHWLGFAQNVRAVQIFRDLCMDWQEKIASAQTHQLEELMKSPKVLKQHLEGLISEDPEMCIDIIEAIAARIDAQALIILKLKAAADLGATDSARVRKIAEAFLTSRKSDVRMQTAYVFRVLGDEERAQDLIFSDIYESW